MGEYQKEMNSAYHMRWIKGELLPNLSQTVLSWLLTPFYHNAFRRDVLRHHREKQYGKSVVEA
jgi:hypothetical protein